MIVVRFVRTHRMYQPGESAGFDDAEAQRLIESGVAVDPKKADAAAAAQARKKAKAEAEAKDNEEAEAKAKAEAEAKTKG